MPLVKGARTLFYGASRATTVVLLVRFGEIALKSRWVRRHLRDRLVSNIQDLFAAERVECLTRADHARIFVEVNDVGAARRILHRAFGVVSFSPAEPCPPELESIAGVAVGVTRGRVHDGVTFAVRARRSGSHPFTSQDVARVVGAEIQKAIPRAIVDLDEPEVEIFIEVRDGAAYVFTDVVPGPGGLPLGSQGPALALVEGPRGIVAAWMAMRRGCKLTVATPAEELAEPLRRWDVHLKVLVYRPGDDLVAFLRLARAKALFLGSSIGDLPGERPNLPVPVFHPTIGLGDNDVHERLQAIAAA